MGVVGVGDEGRQRRSRILQPPHSTTSCAPGPLPQRRSGCCSCRPAQTAGRPGPVAGEHAVAGEEGAVGSSISGGTLGFLPPTKWRPTNHHRRPSSGNTTQGPVIVRRPYPCSRSPLQCASWQQTTSRRCRASRPRAWRSASRSAPSVSAQSAADNRAGGAGGAGGGSGSGGGGGSGGAGRAATRIRPAAPQIVLLWLRVLGKGKGKGSDARQRRCRAATRRRGGQRSRERLWS